MGESDEGDREMGAISDSETEEALNEFDLIVQQQEQSDRTSSQEPADASDEIRELDALGIFF